MHESRTDQTAKKPDKSTVVAGDFNTSHSVTNRTCKLKFTETRDI